MKNTSLRSPKAKLERAKYLIKEADASLSTYTNSAHLSLNRGPHPNASGDDHVIILRAEEDIPDMVVSIAGDAVHNIRSALDHLACCLAVKNGKTMSGVSFPFDETQSAFEHSSIKKIQKLSVEAQNKIKSSH